MGRVVSDNRTLWIVANGGCAGLRLKSVGSFHNSTERRAAHPCILKLLVLMGARASARFGVYAGKTLKFPDRSGVLKLKRRKRRAPLRTTSGCIDRSHALTISLASATAAA